jgi:hypothetical protein
MSIRRMIRRTLVYAVVIGSTLIKGVVARAMPVQASASAQEVPVSRQNTTEPTLTVGGLKQLSHSAL